MRCANKVTCSGTQRGVVLITSLIFILAVTIMGFAGMGISSQQERMAANMRNKQAAFEAAEAALFAAEDNLESTNSQVFNDTNGLYSKPADGSARWQTIDWQDPSEVVIVDVGFQLPESPSYYIETYELGGSSDSLEIGAVSDFQYYRITARAVGRSRTAVVILQSIYRRE